MNTIEDISLYIDSHPLADEFHEVVASSEFNDLESYVKKFRAFCSERNVVGFNNELWFNILEEKCNDILYELRTHKYWFGNSEQSKHYLSIRDYNMNLKVNEDVLDAFLFELNSCSTERKYSEKQSVRYKSFIEVSVYKVYSCSEFFLNQYMNAVHPLVQTIIGCFLMNGGDTRGVRCIFNALLSAVMMPNIYWHTERALQGFVGSIWEILRLCKKAKITGNEVRFYQLINKLVTLLFLYMSRCIELSSDENIRAEIYSLRAELFYHFRENMFCIFNNYAGWLINSDLYFAADKYLAYSTASLNSKSLYIQCLWDSMKMYRYGSLSNFNSETGYVDVVDEDFLNMVENNRKHSLIVAQSIYDKDKNGNVYLTKDQVEDLFSYISEANIDFHLF